MKLKDLMKQFSDNTLTTRTRQSIIARIKCHPMGGRPVFGRTVQGRVEEVHYPIGR